MTMQRIRLEFNKGGELRFIPHLDLIRAWHRAFRRSGIPLAYSDGVPPRPKFSLAAPLAVGATGERELLDVYLQRRVSSLTLMKAVNAHLPPGLSIRTAEDAPPSLPSLQSLVHAAEYTVEGVTAQGHADVEAAIQRTLALSSLPWEHQRETETRRYDLRALIFELRLRAWDETPEGGRFTVTMRLRADDQGTGRPDQVMAALGLSEEWDSIHRTRLVLRPPKR